jgi:hypothetical protein
VICGALAALSHIAQDDRDRAVGLANDVLSRFNAPGVEDLGRCREFATTFIFDTYVWTENSAARDFAVALVGDIRNQSSYVKLFIARYSGELLVGSTSDVGDGKHGIRAKVLKLYRDALDGAVGIMTALAAESDLTAFSSWPAARRSEFQDIVMDCLDVFVRAGWPNAQALTFRLGEIWR